MSHNREQALSACHTPLEVPFSLAEYRARLDRVRARMDRDGIDLLFVSAPEGMFYLSGYQCEWYQAQSPKGWSATSGIAVHRDRDTFILFDTPSEAVLVRQFTVATDIRIFPITGRRDGVAFIASELQAAGWLTQGTTVALERYSYRPNPATSARFQAAFEAAGASVVDGSDVLRDVRWIKSPSEMACIRQAARIADIGLAAARDALVPGVTELDVYGEMVRAMAQAGGENPGIVQPVLSGPKTNAGHALATRKKIMPGERVNIDVSGVYNRYHCNVGRSFFIDEPPADVADHHAKAAGVFSKVAEILRPNLPVRDLNAMAKAYYEDCGIWADGAWLGGYEMGIAFPPDWVGNYVFEYADDTTEDVFAPGTSVNFESVFYGPRLSGLTVIIDSLAFEDHTAEWLSETPVDLAVVSWSTMV